MPEVPEHYRTYQTAFWDLSTERPVGMGLGPLPLSIIKRYVTEDMGLSGEAHAFAVDVLRAVDNGYLTMRNEKPGEVKPGDVDGVKRVIGRAARRGPDDKRKRKTL